MSLTIATSVVAFSIVILLLVFILLFAQSKLVQSGDDYIGFGSDYDGLGNTLPKNLKDVSTYINLIEGLIKRAYSKESIEKICYKNFFRAWNANLQNHQI